VKFQIMYRADLLEVHSFACTKLDTEDMWAVELVDADHQYGAAWDAWGGKGNQEQRVIQGTLFYPCLNGTVTPARRGRYVQRELPFDPAEDLDAAVIAACYGRKIVWTNSISGGQDTARLFPEGPRRHIVRNVEVFTEPHKHTSITVSKDGRRSLNFIDAGGYGFRSVALDSIVSVK
jgi:hypothetical protein